MENNSRLLRLTAAHQAHQLEIQTCLICLCLLSADPRSSRLLALILKLPIQWHGERQADARIDRPVVPRAHVLRRSFGVFVGVNPLPKWFLA